MIKQRLKNIEKQLQQKGESRFFVVMEDVVMEDEGKFRYSKEETLYNSLEELKNALGIKENDTIVHVSKYL